MRNVFPAHAGMSQAATLLNKHLWRFPRSRGDEPSKVKASWRSWLFSPRKQG